MQNLTSFLHTLAHAKIAFYTLAWLMVLLVLGTVTQKYVGLYAAQQTFFYAWIWWVGPIPLPSGLAALGFLTLSLVAKLAVASPWRADRAGIILSHIGSLMLLFGGLVTFTYAQEGSMTLFKGDRAGHFIAYHDRQLVVEKSGQETPLGTLDFSDLKAGKEWHPNGLPFTVRIVKTCRNCAFTPRPTPLPLGDDKILRGRARMFDLSPKPPEKEDEANQSAILFEIKGSGTDKDGIHLSTDFVDIAPWVKVGADTYTIGLRKRQIPLPFDVELMDFQKKLHPGTDMAAAYESTVMIYDHAAHTRWQAHIRMNEPLRYRGYTLYQASFLQDGDRTGTVLAVVQNVGRAFPYLSSGVLCLGLLIHVFMRLRKYRIKMAETMKDVVTPAQDGIHKRNESLLSQRLRLFLSFLILLVFAAGSAHAGQLNLDFHAFDQIPIQDQGRIKPMETFARSYLETLSGKDHVDSHMGPSAWLAQVLFDPAAAAKAPLFRIANPQVVDTLDLPATRGHRYSFDQLMPALTQTRALWEPMMQAPSDQLSMPQKQLVELVQNVDTFAELSQSASLFLLNFKIDDPDLAKKLWLPPSRSLTYLDIRAAHETLTALMKKLMAKAGKTDPKAHMKKGEIALIDLISQMKETDTHGGRGLLRVIPPAQGSVWQSPWSVMDQQGGMDSPFLAPWRDMAVAYQKNDGTAFARAATEAGTLTRARASADQLHVSALSAEHILNTIKPFRLSLYTYLAALILMIAAIFYPARPVLFDLGWASLGAGIVFHTVGLFLRMYILGRPPVTNLYDSIIFVGLTGVIMAGILAHIARDRSAYLMAAVLGVFLQFIGLRFDAEGDTLRVLMAVLDTNFWLSTHVVMITLGYGAALVVALMAYRAIFRRLVRPFGHDVGAQEKDILQIQIVACIALFFTGLGTLLGGIWADQSWGRFWGWDPKENGALLLTLWLIWALHGRIGRVVTERGFLILIALCSVVVAAAWFGVNLLGVGLHSYGFTASALTGFIIFCGVQGVGLLAAWIALTRKERAAT